MPTKAAFWVRLAIINLCVVALLGTIMRYKIGFAFPYFNQKYIQEAHSHFAFSGWITHTLFFLIVVVFKNNLATIQEHRYNTLIIANLVSAYGMLAAFFIQGYGAVSIFFSAISMLVFYVFSFFALRDIARLSDIHPGKKWLWGAIWFGIFSTIGTMVLSYMMATKQYDQTTYLGSIFFYLHFQYNGWFLFACIGLFLDRFKQVSFDAKLVSRSFWLFFLAGIPTFFLSTLWANLPVWLYVIVVIAALMQSIGWWYFVSGLVAQRRALQSLLPKGSALLLLVVGAALTIKILLQLGSTIPEVSQLAFSFRPIVIAYLHLVLLLIITVFLVVFLYSAQWLKQNNTSRIALIMFTIGAILNEVVLAVQGIGAFSYTVVPYANEALFFIALLMLTGAIVLLVAQQKVFGKQ